MPEGLDLSGTDSGAASAPPSDGDTVYISFSAEINTVSTESLLATMANLANQGVERVYLLLSTPGGAVMNGMNLYNVLRGMPFELVTHNVGNVDSIGNVVFLAGKVRYTCPQATFMFHGVGFEALPGQRVEEKYLREQLDGVLSDQSRMGAVIEQHTSLSSDQIANLFREQQTRDAAYALGCGIVHEVRELDIPAGARIIPLVFQR